jgi:hypothetical protein
MVDVIVGAAPYADHRIAFHGDFEPAARRTEDAG